MSQSMPQILVTGASGQLGRLVIEALLAKRPAAGIAALVRRSEAGAELAAKGVEVRTGDYSRPETLDAAFAGIDRLLLISSNEIGQRAAQHRNAIDAAKRAGVKLVVYTSLLHADRSTLSLAAEHRDTEDYLRQSGLPFVVLRNGWYSENYLHAITGAAERGVHLGSAGEGRVSAAARRDYAEAAAAVLLADTVESGVVHELAGDRSFSQADLAAAVAERAGRPVEYRNLSQADHTKALAGAGLPDAHAEMYADFDRGIALGDLEDDSGALGRLIGRPTTPFKDTIAETLRR